MNIKYTAAILWYSFRFRGNEGQTHKEQLPT